MILPSKKVLSIFVLTGALVASTIIAFGREKSATAINFANNLVAGEKISLPENPNWQNELSKVSVGASEVSESTPKIPETTTETVSTSLISNYLALKQSGSLDQTSAQNLVDQTLNYISKTSGQAARISKLNIIPDNGSQSIINYGENLGSILKNNRPETIKNELEIITLAVQTKDQNKINELDGIITVYENIGSDLAKMPVPQTFAKAHLDITNGIIGMAVALKEIKGVFNDPVKSLQAMQTYQEGMTMFMQAKKATSEFIIKNKVVYKQGSGGYYLLYGI